MKKIYLVLPVILLIVAGCNSTNVASNSSSTPSTPSSNTNQQIPQQSTPITTPSTAQPAQNTQSDSNAVTVKTVIVHTDSDYMPGTDSAFSIAVANGHYALTDNASNSSDTIDYDGKTITVSPAIPSIHNGIYLSENGLHYGYAVPTSPTTADIYVDGKKTSTYTGQQDVNVPNIDLDNITISNTGTLATPSSATNQSVFSSISPDGNHVIYTELNGTTDVDLYVDGQLKVKDIKQDGLVSFSAAVSDQCHFVYSSILAKKVFVDGTTTSYPITTKPNDGNPYDVQVFLNADASHVLIYDLGNWLLDGKPLQQIDSTYVSSADIVQIVGNTIYVYKLVK